MQKKFPKGSEEWQMFSDFWSMCQKFWGVEPTQEYWDSLVKTASAFQEKYKTKFASNLAFALMDDLDNQYQILKAKNAKQMSFNER